MVYQVKEPVPEEPKEIEKLSEPYYKPIEKLSEPYYKPIKKLSEPY